MDKNLTSLLKSNHQTGPLYDVLRYAGSLFYVISFIADLVSILLIVYDRKRLRKVEMLVLIGCQLLTFAHKVLSVLIFMTLFINKLIFGNRTCLYVYPIVFGVGSMFNFMLVYLAICQYSSLNPTLNRTRLFNFVHGTRNFLIFASMTSLLVFGFMFGLFYSFENNLIATTQFTCSLNMQNFSQIGIILFTCVPLVAVIVVYLACIRKFYKYICSNRNNTVISTQLLKCKKTFKITLKFFSLSFLPLFSTIMRFSYIAVTNFCPTCNTSLRDLFQYLSTSIYVIEPFMIIYLHTVLKKNFLLFIDKIKKFIRNFKIINV